MVDSIHIQNFKSVVDLKLDLGYFNVLIGENGCGKSNILEAIVFGGAAIADKLDHEFLSSRGIRITQPQFMMSAFDNINYDKTISIKVVSTGKPYSIIISPPSLKTNYWQVNTIEILRKLFKDIFSILTSEASEEKKREKLSRIELISEDKDAVDYFIKTGFFFESVNNNEDKRFAEKFFIDSAMTGYFSDIHKNFSISQFIIYSPEQTSLRKFEDSSQISPLGIKGEGIFQYLKELSKNKRSQKQLQEIRDLLSLLDWYSDLSIPNDILSIEFRLDIQDRYIKDTLGAFDQRSTNEGFLFLLFYFTLFISKDTPAFFAIDNIDTALNPKLCKALIQQLAKLAKKHKKQVILTTHNPAVLDGLNLKDNGQRLFVIRRNEDGHTKARRIEYKKERKIKLSEAWTNGFIGGLPDNF